jgi:hypothetical protein
MDSSLYDRNVSPTEFVWGSLERHKSRMNSAPKKTGWTMPFYRFYLLTAADHIEMRRAANCDDDARAVAAAAEISLE